jgi:hypothetical protein
VREQGAKPFEIVLASSPDRDDLVAEIWVGTSQLGEARIEGNTVVVDIFRHPNAPRWTLLHSDLIALLTAAKQKLTGPTN